MESRTVSVRKLDLNDYRDVVALYKELVGDIPVADGKEGKECFVRILSHPGSTVFGAEMDGTVVSIATLHILPNMTYGGRPYCVVENVVTLKSHRGQGLGRSVMNRLIEEAWQVNAYKIMLLTGKNVGAKGFYEKLGFGADQKYGMMLRRAPMRKPSI